MDASRIYVASSWRNPTQPAVVKILEAAGAEVYDFRHPTEGDDGFHWSEIDPEWTHWTPGQFVEGLNHPVAKDGFAKDYKAMAWADTFVLVLPCGRSAHLELGWACGMGKRTAILFEGVDSRDLYGTTMQPGREGVEPELMYRMVNYLATSMTDLLAWLKLGGDR